MAPSPTLPDDVIHLIVDEVALSSDVAALRVCAAVSWSFNFRARKHLFSNIDFPIDKSVNARAKRLVQVLRHPHNQGLDTLITSLSIIVGETPLEGGPRAMVHKSKASLRKVVANLISHSVDYFSILFRIFATIPLKSFTLKARFNTEDLDSHSRTMIAHWGKMCEQLPAIDLSSLIHSIACKPDLESLTFRWIWGLPLTLLIGDNVSTPLRALNIHRSAFSIADGEISTESSLHLSRRINSLQVLTVIAQAPILRFLFPSQAAGYPSLETVVANIPSQPVESSSLFEFLACISPNLMSLTLQNLTSFGTHFSELSSDYLSTFKSLEFLKYTTKAAEASQITNRIHDISTFLLSAKRPIPLRKIAIHFQIYCSRSLHWIWDTLLLSRRPETSNGDLTSRWAQLDDALTNVHFGHLERVYIHFTFFMYRSANLPGHAQPNLELFLPKVHNHPSVSVHVTTGRVCGNDAHEMWALGSDEGQVYDDNVLWQP